MPRGGGRTTASCQPWPLDRNGRDWAKDRFGRPIVPLDQMPEGVRAPGEAAPEYDDPVAAFLKMDAVFRDPAGAAGLTKLATAGGRATGEADVPTEPTGPAVPDWSGPPVPSQPGTQPVYEIFVGGLLDESYGQAVLRYAQNEAAKGSADVVYFPHNTSATALALYIDSLPADARIDLIGHSYGADTAAKSAALSNHPINLLVTVDPVGTGRLDMGTVEAQVNHWINIDAVTGGQKTKSNIAAFFGGSWEKLPQGIADVFIAASANHEEFAKMMTTAGPNGISAQQSLGRAWKR